MRTLKKDVSSNSICSYGNCTILLFCKMHVNMTDKLLCGYKKFCFKLDLILLVK